MIALSKAYVTLNNVLHSIIAVIILSIGLIVSRRPALFSNLPF